MNYGADLARSRLIAEITHVPGDKLSRVRIPIYITYHVYITFSTREKSREISFFWWDFTVDRTWSTCSNNKVGNINSCYVYVRKWRYMLLRAPDINEFWGFRNCDNGCPQGGTSIPSQNSRQYHHNHNSVIPLGTFFPFVWLVAGLLSLPWRHIRWDFLRTGRSV